MVFVAFCMLVVTSVVVSCLAKEVVLVSQLFVPALVLVLRL